MKAQFLFAAAAMLIGATMTISAQAAATSVGSFKQWGAYTSEESGAKTCFIASQPTEKKYSKNISGRDPAFFMVTTIPGKNIRNEASTIIGYPFKPNSKVTVAVDGGTEFTMFTEKDSAWIENPAQEPELIEAMRRGTRMVVVGTSSRGTLTTDTYSLSGVTAALDAMAKECP